jgi:hypothetical protein
MRKFIKNREILTKFKKKAKNPLLTRKVKKNIKSACLTP